MQQKPARHGFTVGGSWEDGGADRAKQYDVLVVSPRQQRWKWVVSYAFHANGGSHGLPQHCFAATKFGTVAFVRYLLAINTSSR